MLLLMLIFGFAIADEANNSYKARNKKRIAANKKRREIERRRCAARKYYDDTGGCHLLDYFL